MKFEPVTIKDIGKHAAFSDAHKIPVYKESFLENGGEEFVRVPCLNDKFYSAQEIVKKNKPL